MSWHVAEEDLRAYARGELEPPLLWSADTHLAGCAECRSVLAAAWDGEALDEAWARLDAELDAPRPRPFERLLLRLGVAGHTARLLAATPVLRRSWLTAVTLVLAMSVLTARAGHSAIPFLALTPLLPLAGVALSYGPVADPTYEMTVVSPLHGFRLLMIRTVAVLAAALALTALAGLALPGFGLSAFAWLLPALALTATGLALTPRLGPVAAPAVAGGGWVVLLLLAEAARDGGDRVLAPFTAAGQGAAAAVAALAAGLLFVTRDRFDQSTGGAR